MDMAKPRLEPNDLVAKLIEEVRGEAGAPKPVIAFLYGTGFSRLNEPYSHAIRSISEFRFNKLNRVRLRKQPITDSSLWHLV